MPQYYDDEERPYWRGYDQEFLSPEPPPRPLNRRRRHSRDERDEDRPRLQRDYHSDNEAAVYHIRNEQDSNDSRRSRKQLPSPPRFARRERQRPVAEYATTGVPIEEDSDHERRRRAYWKRVPSPPRPRQRRDTLSQPHGDAKLRADPSPAISLPYRVSPPMPPTFDPSMLESNRYQDEGSISMEKRIPSPGRWSRKQSPIKVPPVSHVKRIPSPPQTYYRPSDAKTREAKLDRPSMAHKLSPPSFNRRRHSDMDVPSTRLEDLSDTPPSADRRSHRERTPSSQPDKSTPRDKRVQSLQVPLAVPGSFPSPTDTILPEDSRSETSPSTQRRKSGDARSLASASTLQHSISSSVSGILGENIYRYKPLEFLQFRLVRILPRTMSLIKCELVHYSLEDPPSYVAISYAWGDTDDRKRIQLDGAVIPVSASLHGALFALRAKKESVLVWVDALCIDQQNRDERTQQVQLMTYIYSRAVSVAIWLGPEADDSNMAMKTLSEVAADANSSERIQSLMSSKAGQARFSSVVALYERDYWHRLWVVQEVFNARDITVYCGSMTLPWTEFRSASDVFLRHKALIDYYFPGGWTHRGQRTSPTQYTYSQVLAYHGPNSIPDASYFHDPGEESLLEVMRVCRRKLSADPKDKLYGILGLLDEHIRKEFPVDYSLSVKEVYVRVFDYLLCTTERLDVLCETVHFPLHTSHNLPTWVPDWSHNPETTALGQLCQFSAAGSEKAEARVLDDRRRLEMSAIYLDTISTHGIAVGTLCTLADYIMAFIHWRALLLGSGVDGESQARQEEFCRTLSLDQLPPERKKGSWMAACYHVFASLAHERLPRLPLDEGLRPYIALDVGVKVEDRRRFLQEHYGSRMMGRCFCITDSGFIGMGSGFMAVGDMVVVPFGCSTPVLLRPEGPRGEYRYVGDIYIHGYMDGQAVKDWKIGKRELRQYVLH